MSVNDTRTIPELLSALTGNMADLARKEGDLIRAEVAEKLHQGARAAQGLGLGAAMLIGAFLLLLQAAVLALSRLMDPLWASLLVGVVVGLIGYSLIRRAGRMMTPQQLAPERTARQVKKDAQLVKEQVQ